MGDLDARQQQAIGAAGGFIDALETTPMTRSFKMLTLLAMLNQDALPGGMGIDQLTQEFQRIARRRQPLRQDVGDSLDHLDRLRSLLERNPIAALCGGKGTGNKPYFTFDNATLQTAFDVPGECREEFQNLVRELVDWRLAEYLDRDGAADGDERHVCRVLHAGGRPILKLPDRRRASGLPVGRVEVLVNDRPMQVKFAQEFINVIHAAPDSGPNLLGQILREWFGADAGRPGTGFQVALERTAESWRLEPVVPATSSAGAIPWRHYMREDIPPQFDLAFNPAVWNQGFVAVDGHLFLLVTLEKSGLNKDHRYEDRFLSPELFHWQSQNRTTQEGKHGQLIRNHHERGVTVHLFVRKRKVLDGKGAPFVYCGRVDFQSWQGERPISVEWRLREPVPEAVYQTLDVPDGPN